MKHMPMETDDAYVFGLRRAPSAVHNARAWSVHERLKGALAAAAAEGRPTTRGNTGEAGCRQG